MYKTCNGCKAITSKGKNVNGFNMPDHFCVLGYKMDGIELKPLEFCPKPKTISAYLIEIKSLQKSSS